MKRSEVKDVLCACMHISVNVYMSDLYICMYVYMYMYMHVCVYAFHRILQSKKIKGKNAVCVRRHMCVCLCLCVYVFMYVTASCNRRGAWQNALYVRVCICVCVHVSHAYVCMTVCVYVMGFCNRKATRLSKVFAFVRHFICVCPLVCMYTTAK
jgi:hypothetical protein